MLASRVDVESTGYEQRLADFGPVRGGKNCNEGAQTVALCESGMIEVEGTRNWHAVILGQDNFGS